MPYLTTRKKTLKLQLSPGVVASYDIQPGNGVGLFWDTTHTPDPHGELRDLFYDMFCIIRYCVHTGNFTTGICGSLCILLPWKFGPSSSSHVARYLIYLILHRAFILRSRIFSRPTRRAVVWPPARGSWPPRKFCRTSLGGSTLTHPKNPPIPFSC